MSEVEFYTASEWPHGLRCAKCSREFVEGQPLASVPYEMGVTADGEPLVCADIMCRSCALGDEGGDNIVPLPPGLQDLL